jgi:hypothetical protein
MTKLESALDLAARGFYVFPIIAGQKRPPAVQNWQDFAMRDPAVIKSWWTNNPNDNIGIFTGKFATMLDDKRWREDALLVVDVDVKGEKNGDLTLLRLELEGRTLPDTFAQTTPTGGRHLVYRVRAPVRQGTNVLGEGLDVRSRGGYIVAAGSTIASVAYWHNGGTIKDAPEWLIGLCGSASERLSRQNQPAHTPESVDSQRARKRVMHYLTHEAPPAIEGQGGDETTYKVAAHCKDLGVDEETCVAFMFSVWNPRSQPPWQSDELSTKVHNAYIYGKYVPGIGAPEVDFSAPVTEPRQIFTSTDEKKHPYEEMNKHFAFVTAGGGAHILWETTTQSGQEKLEHLSIAAFNLKFAPVKLRIGKTEKSVSQWWLESKERREYEGFVFSPQLKTEARFYNLWRGFTVEPSDVVRVHPAVTAFLEHAGHNACHGDEELLRWLIGYFAHLVQRPFEKPLVALVFKGGKGVGKNALVERIGALLGNHFLLTSNRRYLIGNFNGHLENCLLFVLDEAFWSGDKQAEGTLKDLITGREHLIEHKGKEPYTVENKTRIAIIGNEDWLVPASYDERRFAVFNVGDDRKQDTTFFSEMQTGMETGGYRDLLRYLLDFDITGLNFNQAPHTQALLDQKHESMEPIYQWWLDCLEQGTLIGHEFQGWAPEVECGRFRAAFRRYTQERGIRSRLPSDDSFGRLLKRCVPGILRKRMSKREDDSQPRAYQIPPLVDCRAEWNTYIGQSHEWPKEE